MAGRERRLTVKEELALLAEQTAQQEQSYAATKKAVDNMMGAPEPSVPQTVAPPPIPPPKATPPPIPEVKNEVNGGVGTSEPSVPQTATPPPIPPPTNATPPPIPPPKVTPPPIPPPKAAPPPIPEASNPFDSVPAGVSKPAEAADAPAPPANASDPPPATKPALGGTATEEGSGRLPASSDQDFGIPAASAKTPPAQAPAPGAASIAINAPAPPTSDDAASAREPSQVLELSDSERERDGPSVRTMSGGPFVYEDSSSDGEALAIEQLERPRPRSIPEPPSRRAPEAESSAQPPPLPDEGEDEEDDDGDVHGEPVSTVGSSSASPPKTTRKARLSVHSVVPPLFSVRVSVRQVKVATMMAAARDDQRPEKVSHDGQHDWVAKRSRPPSLRSRTLALLSTSSRRLLAPSVLARACPCLLTARSISIFAPSECSLLAAPRVLRQLSVQMWMADGRTSEPLGPVAEWPAKKGVSPVWNSSRSVVQTVRCSPDAEVKIRIELWGHMEDHSRMLLAGPVALPPSRLPTKETAISCHRAGAGSTTRTFNPTPPASVLLRALPPPTPGHARKTIYFVRHGESKWNAAKRAHNVYRLAKEYDHPLNETGYQQALRLQQNIRAAFNACSSTNSSDGVPPDADAPSNASQGICAVEAIWASPLTRAVQTAIVGMAPLLSGGRKTLELKLNVREKKNFGGFDSVGRVCGAKCYTRALHELKALDQADGGPTFAELSEVGKLKVDPIEVEEEWWTEGAEDKESVTERLNEFLHQVEHSPAKTMVVVGHSHFFREVFRRFLHPAFFQHDPQLARTLQTKSVPNCSVLCCDLDFTMRPCQCCRATPRHAAPRRAAPRHRRARTSPSPWPPMDWHLHLPCVPACPLLPPPLPPLLPPLLPLPAYTYDHSWVISSPTHAAAAVSMRARCSCHRSPSLTPAWSAHRPGSQMSSATSTKCLSHRPLQARKNAPTAAPPLRTPSLVSPRRAHRGQPPPRCQHQAQRSAAAVAVVSWDSSAD